MQLPPATSSSETHINYASDVLGAADSWHDAEIITPEQRAVVVEVIQIVEPAAEALQARLDAAEAAEKVTSRARARLRVRDVILDLRVNATSDGVLNGPAMRSRESAVFRDVMLDGNAGDITEAPIREEPELAARVHQRLGSAPDFPAKATLLADLGEAVHKSTTARDALDAAEEGENTAGDAEIAARLALRHALEQAYGKLRAAFPGQRDFVESFFPKQKGKSKKDPKRVEG
ncbi:MAG TPA: hypothetical protein VLS89_01750 [Candidatus Nanopelagicales bacterium]|nr:hypothetical protein [Candidatus Nanopelagicales bacterium]